VDGGLELVAVVVVDGVVLVVVPHRCELQREGAAEATTVAVARPAATKQATSKVEERRPGICL
jgi:hypothetical protein